MDGAVKDPATVLDLEKHPLAQKLVKRCSEFFDEVQNLWVLPYQGERRSSSSSPRTPGKELEMKLNRDYGPGTPYYDDFCQLIKQGLVEGWVAATGTRFYFHPLEPADGSSRGRREEIPARQDLYPNPRYSLLQYHCSIHELRGRA